jgi:hypothetical protein
MHKGSKILQFLKRQERLELKATREAAGEPEKPLPRQAKKAVREFIPNRIDLRSKGIGTKPFTGGSGHARMRSGTRLAPASLYTLIALRQGDGKTFVIPKESFDAGK